MGFKVNSPYVQFADTLIFLLDDFFLYEYIINW